MFEPSHAADATTVLTAAAERLGIHVEALAARRVPEVAGEWRERLDTVAGALGLRLTYFEAPPVQAAELAERHGPLITWSHTDRAFITVVGGGRGAIRVATGDREAVLDPAAFSALAGENEVTWAVVEAASVLGPPPVTPRSPYQQLKAMLADERAELRVVIAYAAATGLLSLAVPVAVQALVNSVAFGTVLQPLVVLTFLVAIALGFAGLLRVYQATVVEWIQQRTFVRVAGAMADRLAVVRREALNGTYVPELANRFFDVVTVQKSAATLLLDGVALLLQTLVGMVILAFYHPLLLAFDAVLLLAIAFVIVGLGRGAIETAINESKAKYAMASWLEEIARHPTVFRAGHGRAFALDRVDEIATQYITYRKKHWSILVRQIAGTKVLQAVASAALLGVGGLLVIKRQLTLGQLVAAELIVASVLAGVAKFGKHLESYYDLIAAVDKLGHVFDLPTEVSGDEALPKNDAGLAVTVAGVPVADAAPLIDLRIAPGERVAIKGANGSGKSTLVDILYGSLRPARGSVSVEGVDLRSLDHARYRSAVAVVRGTEVFDGTILDNVRVGRPEVSNQDVRDAIAAVSMLDEVMSLPEGLNTPLKPDGLPLSSGQSRRLMLARAIVGRPKLLILDEALDGVDDDARTKITRAIFGPSARWTVLLTTHSSEVAALCDRKLQIERGLLSPEAPS